MAGPSSADSPVKGRSLFKPSIIEPSLAGPTMPGDISQIADAGPDVIPGKKGTRPGDAETGRFSDAEPVYKRYSVFSPTFWKTLVPDNSASGGIFGLLLLSIFLLSFGQASLYSAFPLFCEEVLGMGAEQVGVQFFYIGLIAVVVQGGLIKYITRWFAEERVFLVGNILMTAGMALIAWSGTISMLTLFIGIMALGHSLNLPTVHSLISKEADPSRMGAMMGTAQGLSGLGRTIGPTWGGLLFGFGAGLPFILTSAILIITIWVGLRMWNSGSIPGSNTGANSDANSDVNTRASTDANTAVNTDANVSANTDANTGAIRNPDESTSPDRTGSPDRPS